MSIARIARWAGFALLLAVNLALLARPSSAAWRHSWCDMEDGSTVRCCVKCLLCWGCEITLDPQGGAE